jgi:hypothetical protein
MKRLPILVVIVVLLLTACITTTPTSLPPTEPPQEVQQPTAIPPSAIPPSATPEATATPEPSPTPPPPTATELPPTDTPIPPTPTVDLEAAMQSANIILYEDMVFSRYVKPALDEGGYTYTDVADRLGTFQEELTSGKQWDLVIAAAEGRGGVQGEFFDYIYQQLEQGASVIMELWILDWVAGGRVQPILDECGIEFQENWVNPPHRGVFWTDADHPIANEPFEVALNRFVYFWEGDIGDLVSLAPGSSATILGTTQDGEPGHDGLLTLCYDGRLLIQTFSTHDHTKDSMIEAWQNYVYFMLGNRYK